jgi:hypothetical protein
MTTKHTGSIVIYLLMLVGCDADYTEYFNNGHIWWEFSFIDPIEQKVLMKNYPVTVGSFGDGRSKLSINDECSLSGKVSDSSNYVVSESTTCRFSGLSSPVPTMKIDSGRWKTERSGPCENTTTALFSELHGRFDGVIAGRRGSGEVTIRVTGSNDSDTCVKWEPPPDRCYKACW